MPIMIHPTRCHTCGLPVLTFEGITADASGVPGTPFEDLIEHECDGSEDIADSGEDLEW